jgi:hypothetical protein
MALHFSRNVVIPVWFAVFALITLLGPSQSLFVSVVLIALGLAVPAMALVLWHDPPLPLAVVPEGVDGIPKSPRTSQM